LRYYSITSRLGIHPVIEIHELEGKSIVTVAVERNRVPVTFDGILTPHR